jgi:hypothetical protein
MSQFDRGDVGRWPTRWQTPPGSAGSPGEGGPGVRGVWAPNAMRPQASTAVRALHSKLMLPPGMVLNIYVFCALTLVNYAVRGQPKTRGCVCTSTKSGTPCTARSRAAVCPRW